MRSSFSRHHERAPQIVKELIIQVASLPHEITGSRINMLSLKAFWIHYNMACQKGITSHVELDNGSEHYGHMYAGIGLQWAISRPWTRTYSALSPSIPLKDPLEGIQRDAP